jgi:hypothetical protein
MLTVKLSRQSGRCKSISRQRTTPWMVGMGPSFTICRNLWRRWPSKCSGRAPFPFKRPSAPWTLKRTTRSRTICNRRHRSVRCPNASHHRKFAAPKDAVPDQDHATPSRACAGSSRQNLNEVEPEETWQTRRTLFTILNQTTADSKIPPTSQPFKDLI